VNVFSALFRSYQSRLLGGPASNLAPHCRAKKNSTGILASFQQLWRQCFSGFRQRRVVPITFRHTPTPPKPGKKATEAAQAKYRVAVRTARLGQRAVEQIRKLRAARDADPASAARGLLVVQLCMKMCEALWSAVAKLPLCPLPADRMNQGRKAAASRPHSKVPWAQLIWRRAREKLPARKRLAALLLLQTLGKKYLEQRLIGDVTLVGKGLGQRLHARLLRIPTMP
jgi:hypothetical protein